MTLIILSFILFTGFKSIKEDVFKTESKNPFIGNWERQFKVLGTNSGIGYEFYFAKSDMNTPQIIDSLIVTLAFVGIAEYLFLFNL